MDVIAVLKEIRRQAKHDNLLTTIETAVDVKKYRRVASCRSINIISKPIDFEILSLRIKGHLEHRILMQSLKA